MASNLINKEADINSWILLSQFVTELLHWVWYKTENNYYK